ncbi:unnamed protein product [Acanthoscelides obtectus]|uniref:Transposase n=1 Tax=Acanthoscelides obtectus TaxID=200917 RepID=A0A9P0NXQ3_ACAOB|nr:unnamed protein product [Acanthoscelides obtectus]CAK1663971.1 hypothetical protein AOBTE_LOCUS23968 [Acanthoscelides obtectus]
MNHERTYKKFLKHNLAIPWHAHHGPKNKAVFNNVESLDHPPYSPDLSPNDFFTFPKIKNRLGGQRLKSPEEAVDAFKNAALDLQI